MHAFSFPISIALAFRLALAVANVANFVLEIDLLVVQLQLRVVIFDSMPTLNSFAILHYSTLCMALCGLLCC